MLIGVAASLLLGFMYVTVGASQVVAGIVFNVLAVGLASFTYQVALGAAASPEIVPMFAPVQIPLLKDLPFFGPVLKPSRPASICTRTSSPQSGEIDRPSVGRPGKRGPTVGERTTRPSSSNRLTMDETVDLSKPVRNAMPR